MQNNFVSSPIGSGKNVKSSNIVRRVINFVLHSSSRNKALFLGLIILAGSAAKLYDIVPQSAFFSSKKNPVNQYLVKLSWMWTLLFIFAAITLTAPLYSHLEAKTMARHFARIGFGHVVWYVVTTALELIHQHSGKCSHSNYGTPRTCFAAGQQWTGLDISGHAFLLSYCILVITEEAANIKQELWEVYKKDALHEEVMSKLQQWVKPMFSLLVGMADYMLPLVEMFGLSLMAVWFVMVTATSLYFHLFIDKVLGYLLAVLSWYLTNRILYGKSYFLPCKPTCGALHPNKEIELIGAHRK